YGDSALKLRLSGDQLDVTDYFTPDNEAQLNAKDADFGAGGPVLVPGPARLRPAFLIAGGKDGMVYLLNPDSMRPSVQSVKLAGGLYGSPAYWHDHLYFLARKDVLKDFAFDHGKLTETPVASAAQPLGDFGATPVVSANGGRNGIVWVIQTK